jgi:hypothetical protein
VSDQRERRISSLECKRAWEIEILICTCRLRLPSRLWRKDQRWRKDKGIAAFRSSAPAAQMQVLLKMRRKCRCRRFAPHNESAAVAPGRAANLHRQLPDGCLLQRHSKNLTKVPYQTFTDELCRDWLSQLLFHGCDPCIHQATRHDQCKVLQIGGYV